MIATTSVSIEYGTYGIHESRDKAVYKPKLTLVGVEDRGSSGKVFGIVKSGGMTHWAYYIDNLNPAKNLERIKRERSEPYFYFDAGGNGHPIRIHVEKLERVYRDLGLI